MADVNANIGVSIDTTEALAQLKNLQRNISQFHTAIARGSATAAQAQRSLQTDFINSINATGKFAAELRTISSASESFTSNLEKNKFSMGEYFRYAGGASKTFGRLFRSEFDTIQKVAEDRVKNLQTQYIKMGRDANGALKAIAVRPLALDMENLTTKTMIAAQKQQLFNELLSKGSTSLINFGKNTQWAGRQLMVGFTIPLTMFGAAASKAFTDIEAQAIRFKRVFGDLATTPSELNANLEMVKSLATEYTKYGIAVKDTMTMAADAAAAGFQGAQLQEQVRQATKLSVLGEVDKQQALSATIALQTAFKMSTEELAQSVDFMNAVENQSVTSLQDMTEAVPRVAPVIRSLGGDVKDMAVFLTAMREGGVNAAEAANGLKSALASMINPTKAAKDMLKGVGVDLEAITTRNKGNLMRTVLDLGDALKELEPLSRTRVLEQIFGKFQYARISALFDNLGKSGSQAQKVMELVGMSAQDLSGISQRELSAIEENAVTKFKKATEALKQTIAPVGEVFLKIATPVIEFATKIAEKFNGLSDHTKKVIAVIVTALGLVAPVVLMLVGLFANFFGQIMKFTGLVRGGFSALAGGSKNLGEQTKYTTTAQQEALAVAHSLDQVHAKLTQKFTVEADALSLLKTAYINASAAASNFAAANPNMLANGGRRRLASGGVVSGPGTGTSDSIPAMLSNGEAVIPARQTKKYGSLVNGIIADNIPGFATGRPSYWTKEKRDEILDSLGLTGRERVRLPVAADSAPAYSTAGVMAPASVNDAPIGMTKSYLQSPVGRAAVNANVQVGLEKAGISAERISKIFDEIGPILEESVNKFDDTTQTWQDTAKEAMSTIKKNTNLSDAEKEVLRKRIAPEAPDDYSVKSNKVLEISRKGVRPRDERVNAPSHYGSSRQLQILKKQFPDEDFSNFEFAHMPGFEKISAKQAGVAEPTIGSGNAAVKGRALLKQELEMLKKERIAFENHVKDMVESAITTAKKVAQTESPSKRTKKIGQDIADGLKVGIESKADEIKKTAGSVADGAIEAVSGAKKRRVATAPGGVLEDGVWRGTAGEGGFLPQGTKGPGFFKRLKSTTLYSDMKSKIGGMNGGEGPQFGKAMMGITAVTMALDTLPGPLGDFSRKLTPAIMGLQTFSSLMPLLKNPYIAAGAAVAALGISLWALNKNAEQAANDIAESAKREAEARYGSAKAIDGYAKFLGDNSAPSSKEFSRNNRNIISADQAATKRFTDFYQQKGNTSTATINQAALKGTESGIGAAAVDIAQRAAIFGLGPKDIAANIKAASDMIGADQVQLTAKVKELLVGKNGQDILKDPLTVEARMVFLQKDFKESMANILRTTQGLGKIAMPKSEGNFFGSQIGLTRGDMSYKDLKRSAGAQASINKSYSGGFGGNVMGALKQTGRFIQSYGSDSAYYSGDALGKYNEIQLKVQAASVQLSTQFKLQTESLAMLNDQFANGTMTQAEYDKQFEILFGNFGAMGKNADAMIAQLNKIDKSGSLAATVLKDLAHSAMADLEKKNPEFAKKIQKELAKLPSQVQTSIYMGYADGSMTMMDLAMIPELLKNIDGKTTSAAIEFIASSGLSAGAKAGIKKSLLEADLAKVRAAEAASTDTSEKVKLGIRAKALQKQIAQEQAAAIEAAKVNKRSQDLPGAKVVDDNGNSTGPSASPFDAIVKQMRDIDFMNQKLTVGTKASVSALLNMFKTVGKGGKGLQEYLVGKGANKPMMDMILGMSPEDWKANASKLFEFDKKGNIKGVTSLFEKLKVALPLNQLRSFNESTRMNITGIKEQQSVVTKLTATGMSYADALDYVGKLSPEVVSALNSVKTTDPAWKQAIQNAKDLNAEIAKTPAGQNAAIQKHADTALKLISDQAAVIQGMNKAQMKADQSTIDKLQKEADGYQKKIDDNNHSIDLLNRTIELTISRPLQKLSDESDILSNNLAQIDKQAEAINKQYDQQAAALELVNKANQEAISLGKQKMSIADALSQGDISAAAQAVQDLRAQQAASQSGAMQTAMDASRRNAIDNISVGGMTKAQIEERQYQIGQQTFALNEQKKVLEAQVRSLQDANYEQEQLVYKNGLNLKAAQDKLKALQDSVQAQIDALTYEGKSADEWTLIKDNSQLAYDVIADVTSSVEASAKAAKTLSDTYKALDGTKITTKEDHIITNYIQTITSAPPASSTTSDPNAGKTLVPGTGQYVGSRFVPAQYKANGGFIARGTDTVPAMLTPGEFVVNRVAAKAYKPLLESINSATYPKMSAPNVASPQGGSVISSNTDNSQIAYNYSISVNLNGSDMNPDAVATAVLTKIKQMDNQRVKGQVKY